MSKHIDKPLISMKHCQQLATSVWESLL